MKEPMHSYPAPPVPAMQATHKDTVQTMLHPSEVCARAGCQWKIMSTMGNYNAGLVLSAISSIFFFFFVLG